MTQATRAFERLVSSVSASLADGAPRLGLQVEDWLRQVGRSHKLGGLTLERVAGGGPAEIHGWSSAARGGPLLLREGEFPFAVARARRGQMLVADDVDQLPPEARVDRESFHRRGVRAVLSIPIRVNLDRFGLLALTYRRPRSWNHQLIHELRVLGKLFAGIVARGSLDDGGRHTERELTATLSALPGLAAILDRAGLIIRVNDQWNTRARKGLPLFRNAVPGTCYLDVLAEAASRHDRQAGALRQGLASVLERRRNGFSALYTPGPTCGDEDCCFEARVERVRDRRGGVVVMFTDCSARRRAEFEAKQHRSELAHMERVATMSELAGSLAHELSQPLTAILSNAQAAWRLLEASQPDIDEIREVLTDISDNDRRAGEVLRRIHAFLRKGEIAMEMVNLNTLVQEVLWLSSGNFRLRHAEAELALDARLPPVLGDRIQLQQVVLNLLLNALDAVGRAEGSQRRLLLRTKRKSERLVTLAVSDDGPGIPQDHLGKIFKSFFTTKPHGLGMGLAIARTIVLAHGGNINAKNNRGGGATLTITLPAVFKDST